MRLIKAAKLERKPIGKRELTLHKYSKEGMSGPCSNGKCYRCYKLNCVCSCHKEAR